MATANSIDSPTSASAATGRNDEHLRLVTHTATILRNQADVLNGVAVLLEEPARAAAHAEMLMAVLFEAARACAEAAAEIDQTIDP